MKIKNICRIVLSSPSDVAEEHAIVRWVLEKLNKGIADDYNIHFDTTHWKTDASPGFHSEGPQGLIDPVLDIKNCDIYIGILWKRFGTPTSKAGSGTEHEFNDAFDSWQKKRQPYLMFYFKTIDSTFNTSEDAIQAAKVLQFKEKFPQQGLYCDFQNKDEFRDLIEIHLTQYLKRNQPEKHSKINRDREASNHQQIIRQYCQNIQKQFSTINLFGERTSHGGNNTPQTDRMTNIDTGFIPLHLRDWIDDSEKPGTPPLKINDLFLNNQQDKHFLVRGLPGSGKTTLLRYLT